MARPRYYAFAHGISGRIQRSTYFGGIGGTMKEESGIIVGHLVWGDKGGVADLQFKLSLTSQC
jgi:hypothetical protein